MYCHACGSPVGYSDAAEGGAAVRDDGVLCVGCADEADRR
jgi:tRNA G26 N,N-dimethylase Trm1